MATSFDIFGDRARSGPVPPVDPADIRSVWTMQRGIQALHPDEEQIAISAEWYKQTCQPGADAGAVFERVSYLNILESLERLSPWLRDGVLDDAVFDVAATIEMSRVQIGVVYNKLPFDVEEFIKQIEKRTQSQ
jgi:hypothetical protein